MSAYSDGLVTNILLRQKKSPKSAFGKSCNVYILYLGTGMKHMHKFEFVQDKDWDLEN